VGGGGRPSYGGPGRRRFELGDEEAGAAPPDCCAGAWDAGDKVRFSVAIIFLNMCQRRNAPRIAPHCNPGDDAQETVKWGARTHVGVPAVVSIYWYCRSIRSRTRS